MPGAQGEQRADRAHPSQGVEALSATSARQGAGPWAGRVGVQKLEPQSCWLTANKSVELCTHGGTGRARGLHRKVTELVEAHSLRASELPLSFLTCATLRPSCRTRHSPEWTEVPARRRPHSLLSGVHEKAAELRRTKRGALESPAQYLPRREGAVARRPTGGGGFAGRAR